MLRVRPVRAVDLDALMLLAEAAGPGMTTLPTDRAKLGAKIEVSLRSFAGEGGTEALYLLVLEDTGEGRIAGTAGVMTGIGEEHGFWAFKLLRLRKRSPELGIRFQGDVLHLTNDYTGLAEVGSLFVLPEYRCDGVGRMVARSRYLLMANRPDLFPAHVISELRGWQEPDGISPFWDAVGRPFFNMDFAAADRLSAVEGNAFIADLMPTYPIYTTLLPATARAVIGRPHRDSVPAYRMLLGEGFRYEGVVDVFDAGPNVEAEVAHLKTVRESRVASVLPPDAAGEPSAHLVATLPLDRFMVCRSAVSILPRGVSLPAETMSLLGIQPGDEVRYVPA